MAKAAQPQTSDKQQTAQTSKLPVGGHLPNLIHILIVAGVAGVCYHNILGNKFAYDDDGTVVQHPFILKETSLSDYFTHDFWGTPMERDDSHKSYRPVTTLTYRWNYLAFGLDPFYFHVVDVVLHMTATGLFLWVALLILKDKSASFTAALLFATHPVHTEAIANTTGRADVLCAVFFFLGFICYHKSIRFSLWLIPAIISYVLAALSKELGLTLIGVTTLYEFVEVLQGISLLTNFTRPADNLRQEIRRSLFRTMILFAPAVALLWLRISLSGPQLFPVISFMDNPAPTAKSWLTRTLTYARVYATNVELLVWPKNLRADYSFGVIPLVNSIFSWDGAIVCAFYVGLVALLALSIYYSSRTSNVLILAIGFVIIPFIPASNLISHVGFVVAERLLYLPSSGYCIILAYLLDALARKMSVRNAAQLALVVTIIISSIYTARALARNPEWASDRELWRAEMRNDKVSFKVLELYGVNEYMLGLYDFASDEEKAAISEETLDKGLAYYHRAMQEVIHNAGSQDFIMWSANWYRNHNMHHKALEILQSSLRLTQELWRKSDLSWSTQAELYNYPVHFQENRLHRAIGVTRVLMGNKAGAVADFERAVNTSINSDLDLNLLYYGRILLETGNKSKAAKAFNECINKCRDPSVREQAYVSLDSISQTP